MSLRTSSRQRHQMRGLLPRTIHHLMLYLLLYLLILLILIPALTFPTRVHASASHQIEHVYAPEWALLGKQSDQLGQFVAELGDVNGDGYGDFAMGDSTLTQGTN